MMITVIHKHRYVLNIDRCNKHSFLIIEKR